MFGTRKAVALAFAILTVAALLGCSEDTNYDQRTVVYVGGMNNDTPYLCDVLSQGDSIYNEDMVTFKTSDDFITEDRIEVTFYNKAYSSVIEPGTGSLGDFLVTGYEVEFFPNVGSPVPVPPFSGSTSILVPEGEAVTGSILLVPYAAKNVEPLQSVKYSYTEIMAYAHFKFRGHYVQTSTIVEFESNLTVNFADPLLSTKDQNNLNP